MSNLLIIAGDPSGDLHGAGAVRFASKSESGPPAEQDEQRVHIYVRCVR